MTLALAAIGACGGGDSDARQCLLSEKNNIWDIAQIRYEPQEPRRCPYSLKSAERVISYLAVLRGAAANQGLRGDVTFLNNADVLRGSAAGLWQWNGGDQSFMLLSGQWIAGTKSSTSARPLDRALLSILVSIDALEYEATAVGYLPGNFEVSALVLPVSGASSVNLGTTST